jgi:hypothetical protein
MNHTLLFIPITCIDEIDVNLEWGGIFYISIILSLQLLN